ncbi:hypothetical protein [uncultured Piscinibacter sp.]|uniref:hypothetical protein n=1 Tax=uncultured Piscinibacter sp. TaxID=1131835 RepID=UPI0026060A22|nr:hypothetical protein [uncultured Piscinibacter sp.]
MNGDLRDDIVLRFVSRVGAQSRMWQQILRSDPAPPGRLVLQAYGQIGAFTDYYNTSPAPARFTVIATATATDSDGDRDTDLGWLRTDAGTVGTVHEAAYNAGTSAFEQRTSQSCRNVGDASRPVTVLKVLASARHLFVIDSNGDGLQDVLRNNAALDYSVFIALAKRDAEQSTF